MFFISTTTNFSPTTFKEFIDYAKKNEVRYASAGIGAYQHVNTEILAKRAGGLQLLHIPFKDGGSGILKDVAGGDIHVTWFNITNPVGMIKAGKVRPLAIAAPQRLDGMARRTDARRAGLQGLPSLAMESAAFAPAGVPKEIIESCTRPSSPRRSLPEMQAIFERGGMVAPEQTSRSRMPRRGSSRRWKPGGATSPTPASRWMSKASN